MTLDCIFAGCADHDQTFALINRGYTADKRRAGQYFETTEEMYNYFLNVLPPMDYTADAFSMSEYSTETLTDAFARISGRFYCLTISRSSGADFAKAVRSLRSHIISNAA